MGEYPLPGWRRLTFLAALVLILVVSFGPAISEGTVNIRVYGISTEGVSHLYVKFSQVELHTAGFPNDSGWITFTQLVPKVDLANVPGQLIPTTILSSTIQSGRYDAVRLSISNSTLVLNNGQRTSLPGGLQLNSYPTLPMTPNGTSDLLLLLVVDYRLLLSDAPSLAIQVLQANPA